MKGGNDSASDRVDSTLDLDTYELGYKQNIYSSDIVSFRAMIQVNTVDFEAELDLTTEGPYGTFAFRF